MQRVVIKKETTRESTQEPGGARMQTRRSRRVGLRKMSGPAQKLFPPDFFQESHSFDSKQSQNKNSGDITVAENMPLSQEEKEGSVESNHLKLSELFSSQLSATKHL